jgi:cytochrome oxidase Cu insertion factor (SCO1/SenC/PrrC family)
VPGEETSLYLIDPGGRLVALFPAGQQPVSIASDLQALAKRPDLYPGETTDG